MRNPIFLIMMMTGSLTTLLAQTNDFYDDAETYPLSGTIMIEVSGEIQNPGIIDITRFQERSLIVKETLPEGDSNRFTGAYRYDGYSLYDILNQFVPAKKNEKEFSPVIDLYVTIQNAKGETVVFSWGEIYYPIHRHEIIIATSVARIVPSKTKELWPLPEETRLVAGHDLLTARNISDPVRITVHSAPRSLKVDREISPLYSSQIMISGNDQPLCNLTSLPADLKHYQYESVFYGRGCGIHSTTPFNGLLLKDLLRIYCQRDLESLQHGFIIIAGLDGYRAVFTLSEVLNRNDQSELLLVEDRENRDGGSFRIFPAADFFSDRAVKAVSSVYLENVHLLNSNFSPR